VRKARNCFVSRLARTQVLIIEEVQQMLAGSAREQRSSFNLMKSITNDLRISRTVFYSLSFEG